MTDRHKLKYKAKNFACFAEIFQRKCPGLSRYYMFKAQKITQDLSDELSHSWKSNWCVWCGSLYSPENIKVRLIPKIPLSSNLKKLLKKYSTQPHSLGKYQNHIIGRYLRSKNKVAVTCLFCNKQIKIEGRERKSVQLSKTQLSRSKSVSLSESLSKIRLKKKKQKETTTVKNISLLSPDSPLLTSTPSMSNLSMSSNNSKWEPDATPLSSKYCRITPSSRKKNSKKVDHLKKLFANQKMETEDSLIDFLQSVT